MTLRSLRDVAGAIVLSAGMIFTPASASAESLRDALVAAYLNSNLLEQNRALLRATDEDVAVAYSALRPQISASSSVTYGDQASNFPGGDLSSSVNLGLELLLFDGGGTRLGVEAAKETVLAARAQLLGLEQQVLLGAVNAYISVLRDARTVALRESNLRLITQELRAARDRFDVGEVTRTDVAQAEARLAEARGALAQAQGTLAISRELYVAAVGRAPGNLEQVTRLPALPNGVSQARAIAEAKQPSIDQAQHQIKANELNAARAKAATKPRVSLNASAGHSSRIDNNSSIGLTW